MGLDMYMVSIEKPSKSIISRFEKDSDIISERNYNFITENELKENYNMFKDLLKFSEKIPIKLKKYDYNKMKEDFDVPENYRIIGFSSLGEAGILKWRFAPENNLSDLNHIRTIQISSEEYEKYAFWQTSNCFVFKEYDITYWRKNYTTQENIYNVYKKYSGRDVENCGYHMLTQEMVEELNKIDHDFAEERFGITASVDDDYSGLFYHEWY